MVREVFPLWQPLLFRHICLTAGMAGILASRYPSAGLLALVLLGLLAVPARLPAPREVGVSFAAGWALLLAFFLAGFGYAFFRAIPPQEQVVTPAWVTEAATPRGKNSALAYTAGVSLTGTITEATRLAGDRLRLVLEKVHAAGQAEPLPGELVLSWHKPPLDLAAAGPGQTLTATLRLRKIRGLANPGVWETESYWRDRGAYFRSWSRGDGSWNGKTAPYVLGGEASTAWRLRETLRGRVVAALAEQPFSEQPELSPQAGIILALLFGDRSFCPPQMLDLVAKGTLAHSLALSGMHLAFAAGLGYGVAHLLGLFFPGLYLRLPRQKAGILLAVPCCVLYLWLGSAPPSLVRAALMLLFWAVLLWLNRPKVLVDGLIWAVTLILLVSPFTLFDLRLQLSAVSVAGIALASPYLEALGRKASGSHGRGLGQRHSGMVRRVLYTLAAMSLVSISAQLAVLPLVLDAFPGTGLLFPLNLIWLPVLGVWVMPFAGLGLFWVGLDAVSLASAAFALAELPCLGLLRLLHWLDAADILAAPVLPRPTWVSAAGYWFLLLLLPALCSRVWRGCILPACLASCLILFPFFVPLVLAPREAVTLTLIDVGQGQSVLVSWRGKEGSGRALIDGGGGSESFDIGRQIVTPVLTDNTPATLDYLINSHPDADHLRGLLFPLQTFRIGRVIFGPHFPKKPTQTIEQRDAILRRRSLVPVTVQAGDSIPLAPGLALEVLHPGPADAGLPANDTALVLRLVHNGVPLALICGDLEARGLRRLLQGGSPLTAQVLVLPHHGSAGSYSPGFYDAVRPALALAACGYANTWHFPAEKVRTSLAQRGIPLETTAERGQIALTWTPGSPMTVQFGRKGRAGE